MPTKAKRPVKKVQPKPAQAQAKRAEPKQEEPRVHSHVEYKAQSDPQFGGIWGILIPILIPVINDLIRDLFGLRNRIQTDPQFAAQLEAQGFNPQGLLDNPCMDAVIADGRQLGMDAVTVFVGGLPDLLHRFLTCLTGGGTSSQAGAQIDINLQCVLQAGLVYFRTRDIMQTLMAFTQCQFGGGTQPPPTNPPPTNPSGPFFNPVNRC